MDILHFLYTVAFSAAPLLEFRFGIPFGVVLGLNVFVSTFAGIIGAFIGIKLCFWILPRITKYFSKKSSVFQKGFDKVITKTRKKYSKKFKVFSKIGMVLFVLLPVPGTGVYTACLVAYIFDFPKRSSFWGIFIGAVLGAILVATLTYGGLNLWQQFQTQVQDTVTALPAIQ